MNENNKIFVIAENDNRFETNDYKEIVEKIISKDYYAQPLNKRKELIREKAQINSLFNKNIKVKDSYKRGEDISNTLYTCDEMTYILSLVNIGLIFMLERSDSHIFAQGLKNDNAKNKYRVINLNAKELLKKYLEKQLDERER